MKREKCTGQRTNSCGTTRRSQKERVFSDKCACVILKNHVSAPVSKKDLVQRAKQERRPAEICLWKREGFLTESKGFEKSIVARIVRMAGLGLLNPFEMD